MLTVTVNKVVVVSRWTGVSIPFSVPVKNPHAPIEIPLSPYIVIASAEDSKPRQLRLASQSAGSGGFGWYAGSAQGVPRVY